MKMAEITQRTSIAWCRPSFTETHHGIRQNPTLRYGFGAMGLEGREEEELESKTSHKSNIWPSTASKK